MFNLAARLQSDHLRQLRNRVRHPVWMGNFRRKAPVTRWGWERGTPVDRYYIEDFLRTQRQDIHGRVLEVNDPTYTERYGSDVVVSDVLDINPANPRATIIADLASADSIPSDSFDCFILTQTLQYIFDVKAALRHAARILNNDGVLLATVPVIARIDNTIPDYWRFTSESCTRLFAEVFGTGNVAIDSRGNCVSAVAFVGGLAADDLRDAELSRNDPNYPVVVCVRAHKQSRAREQAVQA